MIDGKYYDFILDSGATVFLVQLYVKAGTTDSVTWFSELPVMYLRPQGPDNWSCRQETFGYSTGLS